MLQSPTSETKQRSSQSKANHEPQPEHQLHPRLGVTATQGWSSGAGSESAPTPASARDLDHWAGLHRAYGNQAVLRALQSGLTPGAVEGSPQRQPLVRNQGVSPRLQTKLTINTPGDQYEQEADRVAEQVMRMPDRQGYAAPTMTSTAPFVQRQCAACKGEEEPRQRSDESAPHSPRFLPPFVGENLNSPGRPLDAVSRTFFESRFGRDFSEVRIRTDAHAVRRADELGALAYTIGNEVGFARGAYKPETPFGRGLLAHELTHVVQKAEGRDARDKPRCAAAINAARFSVTNTPTTSIVVRLSFIPGKWTIDLETDKPGFQLDSAVDVSCGSGTAAGYEVGIVQVETKEFSSATYFGLTPADGSLVARRSQLRTPSGPCVDTVPGQFWPRQALKPPPCGTNVALPTFYDLPKESYPGWIENQITGKANYINAVRVEFEFVDALAVKTPSGNVNVLNSVRWGVHWAGTFKSNASGSKPAEIEGLGAAFGPYATAPEIPATYSPPARTCNEIAWDAAHTNCDKNGENCSITETNATY